MKKRLHRIGQDRPVDYYITVAEATIDEHLRDVVTTKQATLNAVLDGKTNDGVADDENSVAADLTWRLTQQGLIRTPAAQRHRQRDHEPQTPVGLVPERDHDTATSVQDARSPIDAAETSEARPAPPPRAREAESPVSSGPDHAPVNQHASLGAEASTGHSRPRLRTADTGRCEDEHPATGLRQDITARLTASSPELTRTREWTRHALERAQATPAAEDREAEPT
jgi:hypothetical protein